MAENRSTLRTAAPILTIAALALALSACGGGSQDKAKATPSAAAVDPAKVSPTDLPEIPTIAKSKGAISDATFGECSAKAGKRTVTGSVKNSGKDDATYGIAVSWINGTSDVLARGVAEVADVAPSATVDFKVSATVPEGADSCTFYVVRGTDGKADSAAR